MNHILSEKEYIHTFSEKHIELYKDYNRVKTLINQGLTAHQIHKISGIKVSRLSNWVYGGLPVSYKSFLIAKRRGYFSISLNSKKAKLLAYFIGWSMGDGNVPNGNSKCWFYGHPDDLKELNKLIELFAVSGKIYIYKENNGKMCVYDAAFTHLLVAAGATVGNKTKNDMRVPSWIINSGHTSKIKRKFLQGLFDSELNKIQRNFKTKFSFQTLSFYNVKVDKFVERGVNYLNQLRNIISEFGITTTPIKIGRSYVRKRDNDKMVQLMFFIHSNYINLFNFIKRLGFSLNSERKNSASVILNELEKFAKKEEEKIRKYKEVLKLRKKGLSLYKISAQLDVSISSVKNWVCRGCKPRLFRYVNTI